MKRYPFETRFSSYNSAGKAGLAALVIKNGETVFKDGYGLANLTTQEHIDIETNFRLASVSKQFTAMCIALLEKEGKITDNDLIKKYFEDLPEYMDQIRIKHLIHHTSGLPEYYGNLCSTNKNLPLVSNADVYNFYKSKKSLDFNAGSKFEYSNGGYNLLATLIEKVTGQTFTDFITANIFTPLEMENTRVFSSSTTIPNCAVSYSNWPFFDEIDFNTGNTLIGEDGIYCSINDTEKWIGALEKNTLLDQKMTRKVFSPGVTNDGDKINYGYGWSLETCCNYKLTVHTGLWCGFNTVIAHFPEENIWIVVYSNTLAASAWHSMEEIAKYFLHLE